MPGSQTQCFLTPDRPAWRELNVYILVDSKVKLWKCFLSPGRSVLAKLVCMCESVLFGYVCSCIGHICTCACMYRLEGNVCGLPHWLRTLFFDRVSHWPWISSICLNWRATGLQESSVSSPCPLLPSLVPFALIPPLAPSLCFPSHLHPL